MKSNNNIDRMNEMPEEDEIDLSEYIGLLFENRLLIGGVTVLFFVVAVTYAIFATPIYKADALVQIEEQGSKMQGVDELAAMMGSDAASSVTEIEIIKSRKVLGDVVNRMGLDISVKPVRFPLFGDLLARRHVKAGEPVEPWLGFSSYAWGGERVTVDRFDVRRELIGQPYILHAGEGGNYSLLSSDGAVVLEGKVGVAAKSASGSLQLFISQLVARSDTRFILTKLSNQSVIAGLQKRIRVSEKGRKTGILSISLEGADRGRIDAIVENLTNSYLRQNVERRSEESERMLEFIRGQMPVMRTDLDTAEQALNQLRESKGTIDLSFESQNLIKRISEIETNISSLKLERAELTQKITESHPIIQGLDEKIVNLKGQRHELEAQLQLVPETELESVKLSRDVTVASELYMLLLNKSQELKVAKAGTIGNVRIVDEAVAGELPVKPKKALIVAVSILLGFISGVMLAAMRKALNKTVEDPAVIEKQLGYPIYAEIPFSEYQEEMVKTGKKSLSKTHYDLLAHANPDDPVIESLRSLRTSMQFALMEAENNIVSISGPAPEIGKSFISANFAYLMAESGKKILLIDADLRKGHLNSYFNIEKSPGISEMLSGSNTLDEIVHKGCISENLDLITTGVYPPNPSELLMSDAFRNFLQSIKDKYDLVIIDTPPVLAVTDPVIVGQYVATNFMVVRSRRHHLREIHEAFKRFEQNAIDVKGIIFNGVQMAKSGYGNKYGYGYKYYGYQYEYKDKS
ncbi:MAG: polysaccharide biosynthesis tyrosine autokinase [Pseudomonadota bacterium]